jgi:serine phosphatase RsbU (regulator of sigma subunit)
LQFARSSTASSRVRIAGIVALILLVFVLIRTTGQGGRAGIGFFYAVPVGLATWWFGSRAGLAAVAGCIGMLLFGSAISATTPIGLPILLRTVGLFAIWAGISAVRRQSFELQLSRTELSAIRAALTPPALPGGTGVEVAAAFVPADHGVSGDFYLLTNSSDEKTIVAVGDVTGHGLDSARLATFVRASLASYAAHTSDPAEILMLANRALAEHADFDSDFVTAICLTFDPAEASIAWAVAGHPVPFRLPSLEDLGNPDPALPLGIEPNLKISTSRITLGVDEGVLIYTDGATEARRAGKFLGATGLRDLLQPISDLPVTELVAKAQRAVLDFSSNELRDDLCILALKPAEH